MPSEFDEGEPVSQSELSELLGTDSGVDYTTIKLYRVWVPDRKWLIVPVERPLKYLCKLLEVPGGLQVTPVILEIKEMGWSITEKPPVVVPAHTKYKQGAILVIDRDQQELLNFKLYREDGEQILRLVRADSKYKLQSFYFGI